VREYAVYRLARHPGRCATADATHLVAVVRTEQGASYLDRTAPAGRDGYVVTALDRAYRESGWHRAAPCCTNGP
jgi:hypothetical protein